MAQISERWILWADVSGSTSFAAKVYEKYGRLDTGGAMSREFQPYWTAIIDIYQVARRLAQQRGGSLANTMGDGFFLLGPAMCGYGDSAQWVPDLLNLSRELKTEAEEQLTRVGQMKLKVCLHMGTVHEVPFDGRSAFFGDALN